jgi:hypothetical protein
MPSPSAAPTIQRQAHRINTIVDTGTRPASRLNSIVDRKRKKTVSTLLLISGLAGQSVSTIVLINPENPVERSMRFEHFGQAQPASIKHPSVIPGTARNPELRRR